MNKFISILIVFSLCLYGGYVSLPTINKTFGLPDLSNITEYEPISSIELYDYKDRFVGFLQAKEDRKVIPLKEVSPFLRRAVLAIEDKDFYDHIGVDPISILRAFFVNLRAGRVVEGGSTLTQQLVKNLLIPEEQRGRTISRKIKELLLALELEQKVEKDRILEFYLNQVYWGSRAYGIQRASQIYFAKQANELTIPEAAFLAGLLQAPSYLSMNLKEAKERQKLVLLKMFQFGFIDEKQYKAAKKTKLKFRSTPGNLELYPYYFSYVLEELNARFDLRELKAKGYKIYTGLDPESQAIAERVLNEEIKHAPGGVNQFAFCGIDVKTAQIRIIVGGVGSFWQHQWNRATNPHTIGSAFKPFVYLTGLEKGVIDPETKIKDSKIVFDDGSGTPWVPRNFDNKYWGNITVRKALTFSRNLPAVKIAQKVGIHSVIETARACGITTMLEPNLSLALGSCAISPLEAASAYATFARGGVYIKPILIRRIEDSKGRIIEKNDPIPTRACDPYAVSNLVSILNDVVTMGTGTLARLPDRAVAGKTGTSDKARDVWFIGFTPDFSGAIWGGNDYNKGIAGTHVTGGAIVARVWQKVMKEYYEVKKYESGKFPDTPNMKEYLIDPLTGLLANEYTPNPIKRRFVPGTEPKEYSPVPKGATRLNSILRMFKGTLNNSNRLVEFDEYDEKDLKKKKYVELSEEEKKQIETETKSKLGLVDDPNVSVEEQVDELEKQVLKESKSVDEEASQLIQKETQPNGSDTLKQDEKNNSGNNN